MNKKKKEKMNKNIILGVIVIVLFIIVGILVFGGDKGDGVQDSGGVTREELATRKVDSKASLAGQAHDSYLYVQDLDKSACSTIEEDYFKNSCLNGISLIEKAKSENNPDICHDMSYEVDGRVRMLCIRQVSEGIKNG